MSFLFRKVVDLFKTPSLFDKFINDGKIIRKMILKQGVDPNEKAPFSFSLSSFVTDGVDYQHHSLGVGHDIVNAGTPILHVYIQLGLSDIIQSLIECKSLPTATDPSSNTALHIMLYSLQTPSSQCRILPHDIQQYSIYCGSNNTINNHIHIAKLLVNCTNNNNCQSRSSPSPSSYDDYNNNGIDYKNKIGLRPLHIVSHVDILDLLLTYGANPNLPTIDDTGLIMGQIPLHYAHNKDIAHHLILSSSSSTSLSTLSSLTSPLPLSLYNSISAPDYQQRTPLHTAKDNHIMSILLEYGANPSICDYMNQTPLHIVLERKSMNRDDKLLLITLLLDYGCNPNIESKYNITPLLYPQYGSLCRILLQSNANPICYDNHGNTPLFYTTDIEATQLLLPLIDKYKMNNNKLHALKYKIMNTMSSLTLSTDEYDIIQFLIQSNIEPYSSINSLNDTLLHCKLDLSLYKLILSSGGPLSYGSSSRSQKELFINAKNNNYETPLHCAAKWNNIEYMKLLLSYSDFINISPRTLRNITPLGLTTLYSCIILLLDHNASLYETNADNRTHIHTINNIHHVDTLLKYDNCMYDSNNNNTATTNTTTTTTNNNNSLEQSYPIYPILSLRDSNGYTPVYTIYPDIMMSLLYYKSDPTCSMVPSSCYSSHLSPTTATKTTTNNNTLNQYSNIKPRESHTLLHYICNYILSNSSSRYIMNLKCGSLSKKHYSIHFEKVISSVYIYHMVTVLNTLSPTNSIVWNLESPSALPLNGLNLILETCLASHLSVFQLIQYGTHYHHSMITFFQFKANMPRECPFPNSLDPETVSAFGAWCNNRNRSLKPYRDRIKECIVPPCPDPYHYTDQFHPGVDPQTCCPLYLSESDWSLESHNVLSLLCDLRG